MPDSPHKSEQPPRKWSKWRTIRLLACLLIIVPLVVFWTRTDPEASYQRGLAALQQRDVPAMHRELQILRKYPKYEPQVQLLRGAVFLAGQDPKAAIQELDRCSVYPATRVFALTLAGEAFCRLDRQQRAIGVLKQAIGFNPRYVPAHRSLAIAYYETGSNDLAIEELRKVAELDPTDCRPHRLLGTIHKEDRRYAEAVQDYRATLRLSPQQPSRQAVLLELAQSLAKLRRYPEALKFLDQAQPTAGTWGCRAGCEYQLGHKSAARQAAMQALELNPNHIEGLVWLGLLETEAGRLVPAAQYLERAVKVYPRDASARSYLATVYEKQGKPQEAREQLARIETDRKLREKFTKLNEQANKRPQDASIRYDLGEIARELQLFRLAKKWYQAALTLNPNHVKAQQALAALPVPDKSPGITAQLSQP
ncbi:MAG: tetratricopeptide repeat protein [Planctomycetaceae bacterium]|nr:tetratricopeptide repeat protein [Planctomycetaceae bacterium]